eukprot:scaffold2237_cov175-Ochromonas_danica.AAC.25
MDAQAQDRAHRIGQTRDVHIYRLITKSSIEENILRKSRQKKRLDVLVMDRGNFQISSSSSSSTTTTAVTASAVNGEEQQGEDGLQDSNDLLVQAYERIVNGPTGGNASSATTTAGGGGGGGVQLLNALEDVEDVAMLQVANEELRDELQEFDESAAAHTRGSGSGGKVGGGGEGEEGIGEDDEEGGGAVVANPQDQQLAVANTNAMNGSSSVGGGGGGGGGSGANEERAAEEEFQRALASNSAAGTSFVAVERLLRGVDRYAVRYRTVDDPFYSLYYLHFTARTAEVLQESGEAVVQGVGGGGGGGAGGGGGGDGQTAVDIEAVEEQKRNDERQALTNGEVITTLREGSSYRATSRRLLQWKQWYTSERRKKVVARRCAHLLGSDWSLIRDPTTSLVYYYNSTTSEVSFSLPTVLRMNEEFRCAQAGGYAALPRQLLEVILSYLYHTPELAHVCKGWYEVCCSDSLLLRVLSVEQRGSNTSSVVAATTTTTTTATTSTTNTVISRERVCVSLSEAVTRGCAQTSRGECVLLHPGHHWETTSNGLVFTRPIVVTGEQEKVTDHHRHSSSYQHEEEVVVVEEEVEVGAHPSSTDTVVELGGAGMRIARGTTVILRNLTLRYIVPVEGGGGGGIIEVEEGARLWMSNVTICPSPSSSTTPFPFGYHLFSLRTKAQLVMQTSSLIGTTTNEEECEGEGTRGTKGRGLIRAEARSHVMLSHCKVGCYYYVLPTTVPRLLPLHYNKH